MFEDRLLHLGQPTPYEGLSLFFTSACGSSRKPLRTSRTLSLILLASSGSFLPPNSTNMMISTTTSSSHLPNMTDPTVIGLSYHKRNSLQDRLLVCLRAVSL